MADGRHRDRHLEKSKMGHSSETVRPIGMKCRTDTHIALRTIPAAKILNFYKSKTMKNDSPSFVTLAFRNYSQLRFQNVQCG